MENKEQRPKPETKAEPKIENRPSEPKKASETTKTDLTAHGKLAAVLIRNTVGASPAVRDTLKMLRLKSKHTCVVLDNNKINKGMLNKVKDYTSYGEITDATLKLLQEKRGRKEAEKKANKDSKTRIVFHLHPPRGGFEKKGIKHSFTQGGALGYRGSKMDNLIKRMI